MTDYILIVWFCLWFLDIRYRDDWCDLLEESLRWQR